MEDPEVLKHRRRYSLRRAQIISALTGVLITFTMNEVVSRLRARPGGSLLDWCTVYLWALVIRPTYVLCRLFGLPWSGDNAYGASGIQLWFAVVVNACLFLAVGTAITISYAKLRNIHK